MSSSKWSVAANAFGPLLLFLSAFTSPASASASASASAVKETVLYSFQANPDGAIPAGGVTFDAHGNLYGATQDGGTPGVGAVFELVPPTTRGGAWTETIIHSLQGGRGDGDIASSGVISDSAGNLYGVAEFSGTGNCTLGGQDVGCGVVYELTPPAKRGGAWSETVIYSFQGGNDGEYPSGNLLLDASGNLYGTTVYGGGSANCSPAGPSCGTVFELSPPAGKSDPWTENILYSFQGGNDGGYPNGQLVADARGALYGTTYVGGNQGCKNFGEVGCGTAFALKPPGGHDGAWAEKVLHRFTGGSGDGGNPGAGLVFDTNGDLYGTTVIGGSASLGTVFRLIPPARRGSHWKEALLHSFGGSDGINPQAGLTLSATGDLYGVACCGSGSTLYGTIFRLKPVNAKRKTWNYAVVYAFKGNPDGAAPAAGLTFDSKGNLYGTSSLGGTARICNFYGITGCGTVFRLAGKTNR